MPVGKTLHPSDHIALQLLCALQSFGLHPGLTGGTATCVVKVKAAVVPVSSVALDKTELTLTVGDPDVKLVATVTPDNATDKTVNWASDKAEVATVDNQGSVHAVAPGEAIITVTTTDGGKTATCTVTVQSPQQSRVFKRITFCAKPVFIVFKFCAAL